MSTAMVRTGTFVLPQMVLFYLNLLWLSCSFLEKSKKRTYYILIFILIAIHVLAFGPIDMFMDKAFPLDVPQFKNRTIFLIFFGRLMSSIPPLIISALIWKSLQLSKKTEESFELKNKMLHAETKALKAQINPHFLFNSMNNIYSLAQIKSDQTGDAILRLSEILRFVTYESDKDRVGLTEELKQIDNFIELQFLKDDNHDNVSVDISGETEHLQIAPMLLLPFIENCFKHSNFENQEKGWIRIILSVKNGHLILKTSNSASLNAGKKDGIGGVGMENVKRRLALIYPKKHSLNIKQNEKSYSVELDLNLLA
jgi:two-component system LytT family sensor kinase